MLTHFRRTALLALLCGTVAAPAFAAPIQPAVIETVKDRTTFIPQRKYQALQGKTIGVLVSNVQAVLGHDGRSGPADAYGFSASGNSYRWIYVPVTEKPLITNLSVRVGPDGAEKKVYSSLSLANAPTVKQWDIEADYSLVEVQVNDALGAPAEEGFVATHMRRLDGTRDYPVKLTEIIADVRKRQQQHLKEQQKEIDTAWAEIMKTALKDRKLTGPRETNELFYITWMPETGRYRLCFRTTMTDGVYQFGNGANIDPRLPPQKLPPQADTPRLPPPPRLPIQARFGTSISVEYGVAYEVSKAGKLERVLILPPKATSVEIPPPPAIRRGPVDRLPPQPLIEKD